MAKSRVQSKTYWGLATVLASQLAPVILPAIVAAHPAVEPALVIAGTVLAAYGRETATTPLRRRRQG